MVFQAKDTISYEPSLAENARALVQETKEFIEANSSFFGKDFEFSYNPYLGEFPDLVKKATALRQSLNFIGNQMNIEGGEMPVSIVEIGQLIRQLDLVIARQSYYVQSRLIYAGDHPQVVKMTKTLAIEVKTVLAMEVRYGSAELAVKNDETPRVNDTIPYREVRQRKLYQVLRIGFATRGKVEKVVIPNGELGWMILNLNGETLRRGMDKGHALGRIWEASEMHELAREAAQRRRLDTDGSHGVTLISNRKHNGSGFDQDRLGIATSQGTTDFNAIEGALKAVGREIGFAMKQNPTASERPIRGGAQGLRPLSGIFEA